MPFVNSFAGPLPKKNAAQLATSNRRKESVFGDRDSDDAASGLGIGLSGRMWFVMSLPRLEFSVTTKMENHIPWLACP